VTYLERQYLDIVVDQVCNQTVEASTDGELARADLDRDLP